MRQKKGIPNVVSKDVSKGGGDLKGLLASNGKSVAIS